MGVIRACDLVLAGAHGHVRCMPAPTNATAVLFPGQGVSLAGAQEPVRDACRELYERCCVLLGDDPFERAGESTRFAQPAIFLASIAGWRSLNAGTPLALAGHSLGELSALAAAQALTLEDALSLVVLRGSLMADAAQRNGDGGMLALLKGTPTQARALAQTHGVVIANDNAAGQVVLSGARAALTLAALDARRQGLRAMRLDVAGAFHSPAMAAARGPLHAALDAVTIAEPRITVFSSMTAAPFRDIPRELADAIVRPVRWRATMAALAELGAVRYVDTGPDRVLARLVARNLPGVEGEAIEDLHGIHA
jgi:[acyl-carrier-protein] S-malonyltransferase